MDQSKCVGGAGATNERGITPSSWERRREDEGVVAEHAALAGLDNAACIQVVDGLEDAIGRPACQVKGAVSQVETGRCGIGHFDKVGTGIGMSKLRQHHWRVKSVFERRVQWWRGRWVGQQRTIEQCGEAHLWIGE